MNFLNKKSGKKVTELTAEERLSGTGEESLRKELQDLITETQLFQGKDSETIEKENKDSKQPTVNELNKCPMEDSLVELAPSLNDNKPFTNLIEELVEIMDEFESYSPRLEKEESRAMVKLFISRLYEIMERAGLELIDSDPFFSILRHLPQPMALIKEGHPLEKTLRPGLSMGKRVFRKALVEIQSEKI